MTFKKTYRKINRGNYWDTLIHYQHFILKLLSEDLNQCTTRQRLDSPYYISVQTKISLRRCKQIIIPFTL